MAKRRTYKRKYRTKYSRQYSRKKPMNCTKKKKGI